MVETRKLRPMASGPVPALFFELHDTLASRSETIAPFVTQLMWFIRRFTKNFSGAAEADDAIEIALLEALSNAVIHGNHENPEKQVSVSCRCSMDGEVSITIRDQGDGFDSQALNDPTNPQNRLLTHGRGVYLMRALMDEVSFEEGGSVVRMRKRVTQCP